MRKIFTISFFIAYSFNFLFSQEVRTFDGSNNNLANPQWGATFTQMARIAPPTYADNIAEPGGQQRAHPRKISNEIFAQPEGIPDHLGLSDFVWAFGQFIDHDITLIEGNPEEPAMIHVNFPDPQFNPGGALPNVMIPMFRNNIVEGTGTSESNPREHFNEITAWIDGSAVYGSDPFRAAWLRSFQDGKLKVSADNLLPFNTRTGEFEEEIDIDAPHMADDVRFSEKLFVAGDPRANENVILTSYHTLFVREHNRICDELKLQYPNWQDERLYQHARKIVGGIIQRITFDEWLPVMGVDLDPYQRYNSTVDPAIINGFSAAAFRLGHTLLSGDIMIMDEEGNERLGGAMRLRDVFFNPMSLINNGGIDPFFRGLGAQMQQRMDSKMVDDVRNFLFGRPGSGGLDLAAININRGRERGIADFNTYREVLGLKRFSSFEEINNNPDVVAALEFSYANVNDIDAWVGMMAEKPAPNALVGETVQAFLKLQFENLRDGDRFYYENDPGLNAAEKAAIKTTTMRDVLMRNTNIHVMQENVFKAKRPSDICGFYGETASIEGSVTDEFGTAVTSVALALTNQNEEPIASMVADGTYKITNVATCENMNLNFSKDGDYYNGVSTIDLILMLRHILNLNPLRSPYKLLAADVNNSKTVTVADIVAVRRLILGQASTFPNETPSWRFVPTAFIFPEDNPLSEPIPEYITVNLNKDQDHSFIAVKMGDLNGTATSSATTSGNLVSTARSSNPLIFQTAEMEVLAGNTYTIPFEAVSTTPLLGYQLALTYNQQALTLENTNLSTLLKEDNIAISGNRVTVSWNHFEGVAANNLDLAFTFVANQDGLLSDLLTLESNAIQAEAYDEAFNNLPIQLSFTEPTIAGYELYQNQPNPFDKITNIGFSLPESSSIELSIFDAAGKELQLITGIYDSGFHTIPIKAKDLQASGILYYRLKTDFGNLTKKMIIE